MERSLANSRYSKSSFGNPKPMPASWASTSASVDAPVLVFLMTGSWSFSNNM